MNKPVCPSNGRRISPGSAPAAADSSDAHAGGPHRHYPLSGSLGEANRFYHVLRHGTVFAVDDMLLCIFLGDRGKGIQPHLQGYGSKFDALFFKFLHQLVGKMQPGGWRGCRTRHGGIDGLVALPILQSFVDVGRQGHMPGGLEKRLNGWSNCTRRRDPSRTSRISPCGPPMTEKRFPASILFPPTSTSQVVSPVLLSSRISIFPPVL